MLSIIQLLLPTISTILTRIIPDQAKASEASIEIQKAMLDQQADLDRALYEAARAQAEVNLKEAEHPSLFVAGWRPATGWICVLGMLYSFAGQPTIAWMSALLGGPAPPVVDTGVLVTLLSGMLGLAGVRTFEKVRGVERINLHRPVLKRESD